MKNKLIDLNDHLFAQLERLNNEALQGEALRDETNRAKALTQVAGQIVSNAQLALEAERFCAEYGLRKAVMPQMLDAKPDLPPLGSKPDA